MATASKPNGHLYAAKWKTLDGIVIEAKGGPVVGCMSSMAYALTDEQLDKLTDKLQQIKANRAGEAS